MASPEPTLTVILSPTAAGDLHGIWQWNAEHYGPPHADTYVRYLKDRIYDLARLHAQGKAVSGRPDLRDVIIRRRTEGHGHLVVYRIDNRQINVLHIFHSARDWPTKLAEENPNP